MSNLPKLVKDFRIYADGYDTGASCSSVTLPKITQKVEEINIGSFIVPYLFGLEMMEAELELYEHDKYIMLEWGLLNKTTGQLITFRGYQEDNYGNSDEIRIDMRGFYKEFDLGQVSKGESVKQKFTISLTQFAYYINYVPYIVVEPLTNTLIIGGINQLDKQKKALGII